MKPIPDGWVHVARYDQRVAGEHQDTGPSGDYQRLLRELGKKSSRIAAYKDGGQWVARDSDIKEFLADVHRTERETRRANDRTAVKQEKQPWGNEQTRAVILLLVRIAEALESIATQPTSGHHTPFVTHLHASTNGEA